MTNVVDDVVVLNAVKELSFHSDIILASGTEGVEITSCYISMN